MKLHMFLVVIFATGASCASSEHIKRNDDGGIIALKNAEGANHDKAMATAKDKMDSHCGKQKWKVLDEERVAVGKTSQVTGGSTYASGTSTDVTEWHVTYKCMSKKQKKKPKDDEE